MTSEIEMTIEELRRKLQKIKEVGWIRSARSGPTGIGHTLEGLLGYAENNISLPDWGTLEIKTTRKDQTNLVTLFSKTPTRVPGLTPAKLIEEHGYWDDEKNRQALYTTVTATEVNSLGWVMAINPIENRIEFFHNGEMVAYQNLESLQDILSKKLSNLALILAERKIENNVEYFRYDEAYLLANPDIEGLAELIKEGHLVFDWRMHLKSSGRARDHGPGYRILEKSMPKLFKHRERLI
jgi:hypothetical protein